MQKSFILLLSGLALAGVIGLVMSDSLETGNPDETYPEEVLPRGDAL